MSEKVTTITAADTPQCVFCEKELCEMTDIHEARPLKDGVCCTLCNYKKVVPSRLKIMDTNQRSMTV